jgi:hypothetical protein
VLLFWQEQGPIQQHVSISAQRIRGKAPEKLTNHPELRWGLELYYDAFLTLDTERSHGMGWMQIPWSSMVRYAMFYDFTDEQTEHLIIHVRAMDRAYIKKLDEDAEAKRKK